MAGTAEDISATDSPSHQVSYNIVFWSLVSGRNPQCCACRFRLRAELLGPGQLRADRQLCQGLRGRPRVQVSNIHIFTRYTYLRISTHIYCLICSRDYSVYEHSGDSGGRCRSSGAGAGVGYPGEYTVGGARCRYGGCKLNPDVHYWYGDEIRRRPTRPFDCLYIEKFSKFRRDLH